MRRALLVLTVVAWSGLASAAPRYGWGPPASADTLRDRFAAPPGFSRVPLTADSFGAYLRELPLEPRGAHVKLFDGSDKPRQDVQAAVVAIDVGKRDLQQCADAVMRLFAEYRVASGRAVEFHPDPGRPRVLRFDPKGSTGRASFVAWLTRVFAEAGSASLEAELAPVRGPAQPGDVLIQGGHPGHAVIVLDAAVDLRGRRRLLIGQSYMPAQSFHVLVDPSQPSGGAWYDEATLDAPSGLMTPEWPRPFRRANLRRFR